jgi:hypothetical protein
MTPPFLAVFQKRNESERDWTRERQWRRMETYEDEKGPEKIQVLILSAGCELIRITASCWHVRNPPLKQ